MNERTQIQAKTETQASSLPAGANLLQHKCACGGTPGVDGECAECRNTRLQRSALNYAKLETEAPTVREALSSPGQPLDEGTRAFMESRFCHNFAQVRVHADAQAAESARTVNALAYTVGRDIVFGAQQYAPHAGEGQQLLAHELAHVVQQAGESRRKLTINQPGDTYEQEAEQAARLMNDRQSSLSNEQPVSSPDASEWLSHAPLRVQRAVGVAHAPPPEASPELAEGRSWYDSSSPTGHVASIYFPTNTAELGPDDLEIIDRVRFLVALKLINHTVTLKVTGYADYRGREPNNQGLSERRAVAVAEHFTSYASNPSFQSEISGLGESERPQVGTTSAELVPHRRVDIVVLPPTPPPVREPEPEPGPTPTPQSARWKCRIRGSASGGLGPAGLSVFGLEIVDLTNNLRMHYMYRGGLAALGPGVSVVLSGGSEGTDWQEFTTSIPLNIRDFKGPARHTSGGLQLKRGPSVEVIHLLGTVAHGANSVYLEWKGWWEEGWGAGAGTDIGPLEPLDDPDPVPPGYE